jgi:hypothetical protein
MQKHGVVLVMTLVLSAAGCVSGPGTRPDRLYPPTSQPLGPEQVSTLEGHVQFVDGKDLSSVGGYFELLPGCHVIGTPSKWVQELPGGRAAFVATTGQLTFALPMRAGHQYRIEGITSAMTQRLMIKAYETDLRGNRTREFRRATSQKDIESCKEEAARTR